MSVQYTCIYTLVLEGSRSCHYILTIKSCNTTCESHATVHKVSLLATFVPPRTSSSWSTLCLRHYQSFWWSPLSLRIASGWWIIGRKFTLNRWWLQLPGRWICEKHFMLNRWWLPHCLIALLVLGNTVIWLYSESQPVGMNNLRFLAVFDLIVA